MADYSIKEMYQGGYSSLKPSYGDVFTGYRMSSENIGTTTDARSANILQGINEQISKGLKTIEVGSISPEVFDSIPRQQLKEAHRMSKLTGIDLTVHAPVVEPSGMDRQGHFTETERQATEKQMIHFVKTAHEISPNGNVPVTFHSSASLPWETPAKGKEIEETHIIDSETGSIGKIPIKQRSWPGEDEEPSVETEINKINEEQWLKKVSNLSYHTDFGRERVKAARALAKGAEAEEKAGQPITELEKQSKAAFRYGSSMIDDSYRQLKDLYEQANKYGDKSDKAKLQKFREEITNDANKIMASPKDPDNANIMIDIIEKGVKTFEDLKVKPQIYKRLNDFAKDKTTETFANVALNSWKEFKGKAPIISIENPPAGGAFSTGKELRDVVEKSKEKFVNKAVKEGLMSKSQAKQQADKLIGVTWDVGHINMMRKHGYDSKDIIKQTEEVAHLVKHIHLSDNFGFEHTELPMGMGNVPIKEMMEKLPEKDVKKIVEAISWYQHFKSPAVTPTLEAFGSSMSTDGMAPYWNQGLGMYQGYATGMEGPWMPQINYETFGGSFTNLPVELGGQRQGVAGSRMSGRPME